MEEISVPYEFAGGPVLRIFGRQAAQAKATAPNGEARLADRQQRLRDAVSVPVWISTPSYTERPPRNTKIAEHPRTRTAKITELARGRIVVECSGGGSWRSAELRLGRARIVRWSRLLPVSERVENCGRWADDGRTKGGRKADERTGRSQGNRRRKPQAAYPREP